MGACISHWTSWGGGSREPGGERSIRRRVTVVLYRTYYHDRRLDSRPSIPRRYTRLHCDSHGRRFFLAGLPGQHTCIIGCIAWPDPGLARMQILHRGYALVRGPGSAGGAPRPPPGMGPSPFTIGIRPEFRGQFWGNRVESPPGRWGKLKWPHIESVSWRIS